MNISSFIPKISNIKGSYRTSIAAGVLLVISIGGYLHHDLSFYQAAGVLAGSMYLFLVKDFKFKKDEESNNICSDNPSNDTINFENLPEGFSKEDNNSSKSGYNPYDNQ